ncbi:MAG: phasin family protein [Alphaproteobacteria bacterium]
MTTKSKKSDTPSAAGTFAPVNQILETLSNVQSKIEVPAAAREFVKQTAETAKTRTGEFEKGAIEATSTVENALVAVVGAGVKVSNGIIAATAANVAMTLGAVEKLADAASPRDAFQVSVDYVRDYTRANVNRAQEAYEVVRQTATEGAGFVQAQLGKILPFGQKKAA